MSNSPTTEEINTIMAPPPTTSAAGKKRGRPAGKKPAPVAVKAKAPAAVPIEPPVNGGVNMERISTEASTPEMIAPVERPVLSINEEAYDWSGYKHGGGSAQELPLRADFPRDLIHFRWFRHDTMHTLTGRVNCGFWLPVTINGAIDGISFTEMFVPDSDPAYPFDEFGFVPRGIVVNTAGGKRCRELYLAARPAICTDGEKRLRARLSAEVFNPERLASNLSGEKLQSTGAGQGEKAALHHPSANPDEPYATPVRSSQAMSVNMITTEKWAGLKNTSK